MPWFLAVEVEFLLNIVFAFFRGEFEDFDGVHDHGVRIMGLSGQDGGEHVVYLVRHLGISPGNVISSLPLSLEGDGFLVPVIYDRGDGVHGHDVAHQGGRNSCRKVSDQDVGITDVGRATWFLKVETYSTREGEYELFFAFFCIRLVDN